MIVTLHYVIILRVYFCLPALRGGGGYCNCDRDCDYNSTIYNSVAGILLPTSTWREDTSVWNIHTMTHPTQHGYTFAYPHYDWVQYREFCWCSSWVSGMFFSARKMDVAVLWWSILYPSSCRNSFAHVGMGIVGSAYCAYSLCGYTFIYPCLGIDGSSIATMVIIIALRYTIWLQVYFYLPMFVGCWRGYWYWCYCDCDSTIYNSYVGILLSTHKCRYFSGCCF